MVGITSYGAYVPYYRMPRKVISKAWGLPGGKGEKAVAGYDEDTITMAVAAGMDCLEGLDPKKVDGLFLATTTAPFKERHCSTIVASALDLPRQARNADFSNCLKSGTIALLAAMDTVKSGSADKVLVAATDMRMAPAAGANEKNFGDGSAALLLGSKGVVAEIEDFVTLSDDLSDNWRAHDDTFVRAWEARFGMVKGYSTFSVEAAAGLMEKCKLTPKDIAKVCAYGPEPKSHAGLCRRLGFEPEQIQDPLLGTVGNTGSALSLMILVSALEDAKPGDRILVISYGSGSDAILFKVTDEIEKIRDGRGVKRQLETQKTLDSYEKYLRWRDLVPIEPASRPEQGIVSMASLWREKQTGLPLYGAKCKNCGTPQLFMDSTSTRARICLECHAKDKFEPYRFADKKGEVVTFSHDFLDASGDPPNTLTVVDFEGGGRGSFLMTDRVLEECKTGITVEMTFRKLYFSRGVHNYFWKCKPVRA